jgi:hypothetical protein
MISGVIEQSPAALKYPARNDSSRDCDRRRRIATTRFFIPGISRTGRIHPNKIQAILTQKRGIH